MNQTCHARVAAPRAAAALLVWWTAATSRADEGAERRDHAIALPPGAAIDQHLHPAGLRACGPAALANLLRLGPPPMREAWSGLTGADDAGRLRHLVDRWFLNRQSLVYPANKRFAFDGVMEADLAAACAEALGDHGIPALSAGFLDRLENEGSAAFTARVHGLLADSLAAGVPPILSLKTYTARRLEHMAGEVAWEPAAHHYVLVIRVPRSLREGELGFPVELLDPNGARPAAAFIHAETRQDFHALKGSQDTGAWLGGRPYLLVQAPGVLSLRPREAGPEDRIIVTANHLIGKY